MLVSARFGSRMGKNEKSRIARSASPFNLHFKSAFASFYCRRKDLSASGHALSFSSRAVIVWRARQDPASSVRSRNIQRVAVASFRLKMRSIITIIIGIFQSGICFPPLPVSVLFFCVTVRSPAPDRVDL